MRKPLFLLPLLLCGCTIYGRHFEGTPQDGQSRAEVEAELGKPIKESAGWAFYGYIDQFWPRVSGRALLVWYTPVKGPEGTTMHVFMVDQGTRTGWAWEIDPDTLSLDGIFNSATFLDALWMQVHESLFWPESKPAEEGPVEPPVKPVPQPKSSMDARGLIILPPLWYTES